MDPLLEALLIPKLEAQQAWVKWRATADIDTVSYASQQLLVALIPSFPEWLEHDTAAAIVKGVIRRIWTQNQLRLRRAVELEMLLKQASIRPLIAGPPAWSLRARTPAIRVIPYLSFLVPRAEIRKASDALIRAGWEPVGDLPSAQALDWYGHVVFGQENLHLKLHWRLVEVPPQDALECESAILSGTVPIECQGHVLWTTSREATLLHILCGPREGDLPWQADVALTGTAGVNWTAFLELARRFAPLSILRLRELHPFSHLAIPPLPLDDPGPIRRSVRHAWNIYRAHSYYRKEALSWPGFVEFLARAFFRKYVSGVPLRFPRK